MPTLDEAATLAFLPRVLTAGAEPPSHRDRTASRDGAIRCLTAALSAVVTGCDPASAVVWACMAAAHCAALDAHSTGTRHAEQIVADMKVKLADG